MIDEIYVSSPNERFLLEAETLIQFDNVNIVKVYEFFEWEGRNIIVMEYLQGTPLDRKLNYDHIEISKAVHYIDQVLNALVDTHAANVMHRDIKPANINIEMDDTVKLMDFGTIQTSVDQDLTRQGAVIGTIQYMAPEVLRGQPANERSEIWSVGILFYKLVTGRLPFKTHSDQSATARTIIYEPFQNPSEFNQEIDPVLDGIIMKMLEKKSVDRYNSASDVRKALEEYSQAKPSERITRKSTEKTKKKGWFKNMFS